jgi:DNA polymerase-3 subunit epsilon
MLGWDCETTGVRTDTDQIVTSALVKIGPGGAQTQQFVIDPGVEVPEAAARIHGWTTERVRAEGGKPAELLDVIAADLALAMRHGTPVVAMNCVFDFSMLTWELRRHGLPSLEERIGGPIRPVIDVYVLDKHVSYRKGSRKLVDMAAFYGVDLGEGAHDAAADTLATARIAYKIGVRHESVGALSVEELHDAQVTWAREQQVGLQAHFDRQRRATEERRIVPLGWPLYDACMAGVSS